MYRIDLLLVRAQAVEQEALLIMLFDSISVCLSPYLPGCFTWETFLFLEKSPKIKCNCIPVSFALMLMSVESC